VLFSQPVEARQRPPDTAHLSNLVGLAAPGVPGSADEGRHSAGGLVAMRRSPSQASKVLPLGKPAWGAAGSQGGAFPASGLLAE
jgi:hypothetical protein